MNQPQVNVDLYLASIHAPFAILLQCGSQGLAVPPWHWDLLRLPGTSIVTLFSVSLLPKISVGTLLENLS